MDSMSHLALWTKYSHFTARKQALKYFYWIKNIKYVKLLLTGMLNPCITINYKITKHREGRCKTKCDAHLKSKSEINHVARVKSYSISIWGCAVACWFSLWKQWDWGFRPGWIAARISEQRFLSRCNCVPRFSGQGKHALPLVGYLHVNELVPPAERYGRLWLGGSAGQWCGDWQN